MCKKATKVFQVCINIVYESFILILGIDISISTALLFCYCGDNVKYGLLSKQLSQRKQYCGWKNLTVTTNF